jgi:hypothetical protein
MILSYDIEFLQRAEMGAKEESPFPHSRTPVLASEQSEQD